MSAAYVIQSGVPVPKVNRHPKGRRKYRIDTMRVGDMFFVPGYNSKNLSAYISRISKGVPGKFVARHCWMWQAPDGTWQLIDAGQEHMVAGATEGTGVWRVE